MKYLILSNTLNTFDYFNNLVIPIIVAIISGVIASWNTFSSFRNEISKMQNETSMDGLIEALEMIVNMIINMDKLSQDKKLDDKIRDMTHSLLTYGNSNTINVTASLMQFSFDKQRNKGNETLVFYAIAASFVKMNVTGIWIDPIKFLEAKITDFDTAKVEFRKCEKKLKKDYKIKYPNQIDFTLKHVLNKT